MQYCIVSLSKFSKLTIFFVNRRDLCKIEQHSNIFFFYKLPFKECLKKFVFFGLCKVYSNLWLSLHIVKEENNNKTFVEN